MTTDRNRAPTTPEYKALVTLLADVLGEHLSDEPMWSRIVIARAVLAALRDEADRGH